LDPNIGIGYLVNFFLGKVKGVKVGFGICVGFSGGIGYSFGFPLLLDWELSLPKGIYYFIGRGIGRKRNQKI